MREVSALTSESWGVDQLPNSPTVVWSFDQPLITTASVFNLIPHFKVLNSLNAGYKLVFDNIDKHGIHVIRFSDSVFALCT